MTYLALDFSSDQPRLTTDIPNISEHVGMLAPFVSPDLSTPRPCPATRPRAKAVEAILGRRVTR